MPVPNGLKGPALADFYYKRAQARALLGRRDALADAELAVNNAQGGDYNNLGSRYEQLFMRLLREAGENKRANALLAKQVAAFSNKAKGKLFGLNYPSIAISATATSTRRKPTSRAIARCWRKRSAGRCSPIYGMSWQALVEDGSARVEEARGL